MGWRIVVIKNKAKLDYKMNYLTIRTEEKTTRILLDEISLLMIENTAVSLTAYLLSEFTKKKIKVVFCNEQYNPTSELVPLYGSHDTSHRIKEQIDWDPGIKSFVHAEIVRAKIRGQASNLAAECGEAHRLLISYLSQVELSDATNREGHAAKVYFNALFGKDFTRSDNNNINTALNYGYGVLLSAFNREIVSCGYLTQLGIFHDNMFNYFNLSCDLMEPFRPFVDREVIKMDHMNFGHNEKMHLVNMLNMDVEICGKTHHMLNAIRIWVLSVFEALRERDISVLHFPDYE